MLEHRVPPAVPGRIATAVSPQGASKLPGPLARRAGDVTATMSQTLSWLRGQEAHRSTSTEASRAGGLLWLRDDPSSLLDRIAHEPAFMYGHDLGRLESVCSVALTMRRHPHPAAAAVTYPFAARYAHLVASFAPGSMMYGSMHLYAGLLASVVGDTDIAIDHLRAAVRANTAMGATPFVALAEHELAKVLPGGDEAEHARADASTLASRLGIPWLIDPA